MSQDIGDVCETGPPIHELRRDGVPEQLGAGGLTCDPGFGQESRHDLGHGGGRVQGAVRGGMRQEEVARRWRWTTGAQVDEQRFSHLLCQRQQAFSVRFTGTHAETPMDPVDIVQLEVGHCLRPEAKT
jgi:hypothetical protein